MEQTIIQERVARGKGEILPQKRKKIQSNTKESNTYREDGLIPFLDHSKVETREPPPQEIFVKQVYEAMEKQGVLVTPINYGHFFYKMLYEKDESFQREMVNIVKLEKDEFDEDVFEMERNIRRSYESIKKLLSATSVIIKLIAFIEKSADRNIQGEKNQKIDEKRFALFKHDVSKALKLMLEKENHAKKAYKDTTVLLKQIQSMAILNHAYDVHSKQYLLKRIEQEIGLVQNFKRSSCFMLIEIDKFFLSSKERNEKLVTILRKVVARILKKSARKSDCIGYYDKGYFGIVLPHTNIEESEVVARRILHNTEHGNVMIGKHVQDVKLAIGITPIFPHENVNEVLAFGMNAIDEYYKDSILGYGVYLGYCNLLEPKESSINIENIEILVSD